MGFWNLFGPPSPEEEARRREIEQRRQAEIQRQEQDLSRLEAGDIPLQAEIRLAELGNRDDDDGLMFTSDLAPEELALLRRHGYKPRGLVTGSAVYHVGVLYASAFSDCEINELSDAYDQATALAVNRMQKELNLIGAHGVVGVRMRLVRHEFFEKTIEVQLVGTAIEGPDPPPRKPWLSDLSGQEWFALHRAGYQPVGLVWGHCAWWLVTTYMDEARETGWSNVEMTHWSEGLSTARHLAQKKILAQTRALGGTGVVGVKIERRLDRMRLSGPGNNAAYERMHHNLLLTIVGTAIKANSKGSHRVKETTHVLSLRDGRIKPVVIKQQAELDVED